MKKFILGGIGGAMLLAAPPLWAQSILDYPEGGVVLGHGWDTNRASKTPDVCVVFQEASSQASGGQQVSSEASQASDRYTLSKSLDISAEVQVKSWLGTKYDAKSDFSSKVSIDESSLLVTELVMVYNGEKFAAPAALNTAAFTAAIHSQPQTARNPIEVQKALRIDPRAVFQHYAPIIQPALASAKTVRQKHQALGAALASVYKTSASTGASLRLTDEMANLSKSNPVEFRRRCGDGFVGAISEGGQLASTYSFNSASKSQQDNIAATLGVSGGIIGSYSGSARVSTTIKQNKLDQNLSIKYFAQGGSGDPIPAKLEEIESRVNGFAASVAQHPYQYRIFIYDYKDYTSNYSGGPIAETTNFEKVAWEYAKAKQLFDTVSGIIQDVNKFNNGELPPNSYLFGRWAHNINDLQKVQETAQQRLSKMRTAADTCAKDAKNCTLPSPPEFDDLSLRAVFPLPMAKRDQASVANAVFGTDLAYANEVVNFWLKRPNAQRCRISQDPLYCKLDSAFNSIVSQVKVGQARVSLQTENGSCLQAKGGDFAFQEGACPTLYKNDRSLYFYYTDARQDIRRDDDWSKCLGYPTNPMRMVWAPVFEKCSSKSFDPKWRIVPTKDGKLNFLRPATKKCLYLGPGEKDCESSLKFNIHSVVPVI